MGYLICMHAWQRVAATQAKRNGKPVRRRLFFFNFCCCCCRWTFNHYVRSLRGRWINEWDPTRGILHCQLLKTSRAVCAMCVCTTGSDCMRLTRSYLYVNLFQTSRMLCHAMNERRELALPFRGNVSGKWFLGNVSAVFVASRIFHDNIPFCPAASRHSFDVFLFRTNIILFFSLRNLPFSSWHYVHTLVKLWLLTYHGMAHANDFAPAISTISASGTKQSLPHPFPFRQSIFNSFVWWRLNCNWNRTRMLFARTLSAAASFAITRQRFIHSCGA